MKNYKVLTGLLLLPIIFAVFVASSHRAQAQTATDQQAALQQQINDLQQKISAAQGQEQTLSDTISVMDDKISLTENQITYTQQKISDLNSNIDKTNVKLGNLNGSLQDLTKTLLNRIVETYQLDNSNDLQAMLTAPDVDSLLLQKSYAQVVQEHDRELLYETEQAKNDYANFKAIQEQQKQQVEELQNQLQSQTDQLAQEKQSKQDLLAQTKGSESVYNSQLAAAKAQYAALTNFARARVGSSSMVNLVPHQNLSDGWGAYYNQRDSSWGNDLFPGGYLIKDAGCLLTSYAMMVTHYGGSITPDEVAANSGFFDAYGDFLSPSANGHSDTLVFMNSSESDFLNQLRNDVNAGKGVIGGLSYDGGPIPDHWVVLRSVNADGSFQINDPLYAGAINVNINDHYAGLKITEARIFN